jgi:hypothetical protein
MVAAGPRILARRRATMNNGAGEAADASLTCPVNAPPPDGRPGLQHRQSRPGRLCKALIAASRRWAKLRPWQVFSRAESSSLVNTGTSFSLTLGDAQPGHRVRELLFRSQPAEELL